MSPQPDQFELDMLRNARDRLETWMEDTAMRCRVLDMPAGTILSVLSSALLTEFIKIMVVTECPIDLIHKDIERGYARMMKLKKSEEAEAK